MTSFNLCIEPHERFFENRKFDCDEADLLLLSQAAELLGERAYDCEDGIVRVRSDWSPLIAWRHFDAARNANIDPDDEETWEELPPVDMPIHIVDERAQGREHDLHSHLELFLHESFLMLNVAVPGSFGGRMRWALGGLRDRDASLDARVFETAWATAATLDWPRIEPLPLAQVVAWYDALGIGTQQVATTSTARALFHLLYLARSEEEDTTSLLRLALALEAVFDSRASLLAPRIESLLGRNSSLDEELRRFFDDRDAVTLGTAPVAHPMYDHSLDARADDPSFDYTNTVDFASRLIVGALQQQVRSCRRLTLVD